MVLFSGSNMAWLPFGNAMRIFNAQSDNFWRYSLSSLNLRRSIILMTTGFRDVHGGRAYTGLVISTQQSQVARTRTR